MNLKKILLILIVIVFIILIIIGALLIYSINKQENSFTPASEYIPVEIDRIVKQEDTKNNYYAMQSCVEKFYIYLAETDTSDYRIIDEEVEQTIEEANGLKREAIYNMLDENYIEDSGITEDNVFEVLPQVAISDVIIDDMYVSQQSSNMYVYFVYGRLRDETTRENSDFTIMLKVDMLNRTFRVVPVEYINHYVEEVTVGQELNLDIGTEIEENSYNTFSYEIVSEETYITQMFNEFKTDMMYDYESAYERLNQEYKEKKFETYEEFETYAKENIRNSIIMQLSQYQVNSYDDYTQYVLVDQNEKYYIFNETGVMQYTVILDTYTIDLPQFTEQYNNATDAEKVLLNIQKVFLAINDGDYNYVYNKLDNTFKANNFPTLESFETYMTQNFYQNNSVSYYNYQTSGDLHIYEVSITNTDDGNSSTITKNFIMQLGDGTDFVMSFNV